jgi:kynurenine formamidase
MIIHFRFNDSDCKADLSRPIDLSMPLTTGSEGVQAFYLPPMELEPFRAGTFVGDVAQGGACNVNKVTLNPHGNGTHTETVGHITREKETVFDSVKKFWFIADLVSVNPSKLFEDLVIMPEQLEKVLTDPHEALIIRTRPNGKEKLSRHYSGTNPAYLHHDAARMICEAGVRHLLIDLPSVDREEDGGKLKAHHAYWNHPENTRREATITELIYVPDEVPDGSYLLNLQVISIMNDASPSKPVIYRIHRVADGSH